MSFKQKLIVLKTFVECQFKVVEVYEFQAKPNSDQDICWVSVLSYVTLWVSHKSRFLWRYSLSLSLHLFKFMSFKQNKILMITFVESQFRVMSAYQFQTKANSDEDICWASVWSFVSLWVSNKSRFLWRHFLSLSLELCEFMSFKHKGILLKTFVEAQFQVI